MLQTSLHLLSVLLVIYHVKSMNINEPPNDGQTTAFNLIESPIATDTLSNELATNFNPNTAKRRSQRNQSIDTPKSVVDSIVAIDSHHQIQNASTLTNVTIAVPKSSATFSGKLYNKTDLRKRKIKSASIDSIADWKCPNISENSRYLECGCDMPQTLRCSGDIHGLQQIAEGLRVSRYPVSLLDCTLKNVTFLSDARIFDNVSLHGLVISSGEIKRVHRMAFYGLKMPLQALGLPNNALTSVPSQSLAPLSSLDRLDLSNNRIKYLDASDFLMLQNLTFLELSDNNISGISMRAFLTLKKLQTLKLNGNRLETNSLQAIAQCVNLKELDLSGNLLRGPLTENLLPTLKSLDSLNLGTNLFTSIRTGAFEKFPFLTRLTLRHNQIDVLQDHSFSGLGSLQMLDLSYNGIVAISGASLKHLSRLLILNLTHNFLRAITSDLVTPLPSLKELRVDGNDISMVAKNAFIGANDLENLSLHDNPLSCDCSLKPFAEWLSTSSISSQDQMSAVCATPPHLEGATLQEIPLDSLNCNGNVNRNSNANVLHQLEVRSRQNNMTFVNRFSDGIILKKIHLSMDYGLILTWGVKLNSHDFACDAIFVYKDTRLKENLMENLPVHCESNKMENEDIVSVILYDTTRFTIGDKYRFCLVLVQKQTDHPELVVGCSNITKLKQIENILVTERTNESLSMPITTTKSVEYVTRKLSTLHTDEMISDISSFDKITDRLPNEPQHAHNKIYESEPMTTVHQIVEVPTHSTTSKPIQLVPVEKAYASQLMNHFNDSLMPSLSIGVLITSVFAFIWAATKISSHRRSIPSSVCYAAADQHSVDIENSNRYLKLQATTTL